MQKRDVCDDCLTMIAEKVTLRRIAEARGNFLRQLEETQWQLENQWQLKNFSAAIGESTATDIEHLNEYPADWVKSIVTIDLRNLLEKPVEDGFLRALEHFFYILELVNEKKSNVSSERMNSESKWNFLVKETAKMIVDETKTNSEAYLTKTHSEAYLNQLFSAAGIQNVLQQ